LPTPTLVSGQNLFCPPDYKKNMAFC
jgi:hypothetical protein